MSWAQWTALYLLIGGMLSAVKVSLLWNELARTVMHVFVVRGAGTTTHRRLLYLTMAFLWLWWSVVWLYGAAQLALACARWHCIDARVRRVARQWVRRDQRGD